MLADPRAREALVANFFSQWLQIRNVWLLTPDANRRFPWFDDNLRTAFVRETELFLESQLQEDRSVVDLLTADYTFLNEQLARHYGISRRLRQPLPASDAHRHEPLGPARQGEHPGDYVLSAPHVADDSRQVAAREHSGGSRAAAAAECEHDSRRDEDGEGSHRARDARAAPRESRVRELSRAHGSAGLQPRELRRAGPMAHDGRSSARSTRRACSSTARR